MSSRYERILKHISNASAHLILKACVKNKQRILQPLARESEYNYVNVGNTVYFPLKPLVTILKKGSLVCLCSRPVTRLNKF